ncbi:m133/m132 protein [Murid betaherpesvirus 1]|nr:m133/m132 protein [Murid betaherpesvirus 1]
MSPPLLITVCLFFTMGSGSLARSTSDLDSLLWLSNYVNETYGCVFGGLVGKTPQLPHTYCYLPEKSKPSATVMSNGTIVFHDRYLTSISAGFNQPQRLAFKRWEFEDRYPCLYCERPNTLMGMENCLMCKNAAMEVTVRKDTHNDFSPRLVRATVETVNHWPYFTCRFRVHSDTQKIETAWLNDDCAFTNKTKDPIAACVDTRSYKKSTREGRYVTMSAKVKVGDMRSCRVCMLKTNNKYMLMGRACLADERRQEYTRNVRIVHALVISVWVTAIALVGFAAVRLLLSLESIARLVKKMFAAGYRRLY